MNLAREWLEEIRRLRMSIDALNAAITQLGTDVATLIAQGANSVPQAQVDAATANVTALDATVKAAITPAPATPAPAAS
jgi:phage shock protein A